MTDRISFAASKEVKTIHPPTSKVMRTLSHIHEILATAEPVGALGMIKVPGSERTKLGKFFSGLVVHGGFITPSEGEWHIHDEVTHRVAVEAADPIKSHYVQELAAQGMIHEAIGQRPSAIRIANIIDSLLTS